eukprot:TRINITY_DN14557_c0_g1_i1.p1 TRINITY_DN14557_c0_g1~~TRINITY_DN14557_c0_g1_i1.p1  ORF type:complete len:165 (-),score=51.18 TRINITY_DN14557_c0_g1_i1:407-901(-)
MNVLFAIRGLLAFVSFTEFTSAGRALLPLESYGGSYVDSKLFKGLEPSVQHSRTLSHLVALFYTLIGLILLCTSIYSHYKPLAFLSAAGLSLKLFFLLGEAFLFGSILPDGNLIFPVLASVLALGASLAIPFVVEESSLWAAEENIELLRKMSVAKSSSSKKRR